MTFEEKKQITIVRQSQAKVAFEFIASVMKTTKGQGVGTKEAKVLTDQLVNYCLTGLWPNENK
jgi:hypothetical protein